MLALFGMRYVLIGTCVSKVFFFSNVSFTSVKPLAKKLSIFLLLLFSLWETSYCWNRSPKSADREYLFKRPRQTSQSRA